MRRTGPSSARLRLASCLFVLWLASGCSAGSTPFPTAVPTASPAPSATPSPQPSPSPTPLSSPTLESRVAWQHIEGTGFAIDLPAGWSTVGLPPGSREDALQQFIATNPILGAALGGAEALQGLALWASAPPAPATSQPFPDNLSIRQAPLDGGTFDDLPGTIDALEEQYRRFDFTVSSADPQVTVAGRQAARIRYRYQISDSEKRQWSAEGEQYLVVGDSDLWIVTFTTSSETSAAAKTFGDIVETLVIR